MIKKIQICNSGSAWIGVMIMMTFLISIGLAISSSQIYHLSNVKKEERVLAAQSLCDAGVEKTIWELNQHAGGWTGETNLNLGTGVLDISVAGTGNNPRIATVDAYIPSKTVTKQRRTVKAQISPSASADSIGFSYGVQVGSYGLDMQNNNTRVTGNVYSNGPILGNGSSKSVVTGTAVSAGTSGSISGMGIGVDAYAHSITGSAITGSAYYATTFSNTAAHKYSGQVDKPTQTMPISSANISTWESMAADGGTLFGNQTISSPTTLGPKKINGNLTINSTLTLSGVLWVTGDITTANNVTVQLAPSFGPNSSMIIADGSIDMSNNVTINGSGNSKSFMMLLSTKTTTSYSSPSISASPNASAAIYYTQNGWIFIKNNGNVKSVTAKGLHLEERATVTYDSGLASAVFTTGPSVTWSIDEWRVVYSP